MKRSVIFTILILATMLMKAQHKENYLVVGTYTNEGDNEGIYVYNFNNETGDAAFVSAVNTDNPTFLAVSPDEKYIYAVYENKEDTGSIAAFSFDKENGRLEFINKQPSGNHPCHVTIDKTGKWVVAANYRGGSFSVFSVNPDGSLTGPTTVIQHSGSGINKERQDQPHTHCTCFSPDNHWLYAADLGIDKLMIYSFNDQTGKVAPATPSFALSEPGSGPRHFTFHPNNKFAYLVEELSGSIVGYHFNNGTLEQFQRITTIPEGITGYPGSADIHVSPDGKFLYATNRGVINNIAIYTINQQDGTLTLTGFHPALGKEPRNFNFDPPGNFLLVANQETNEIIIFKRNTETGLLTDTGKRISVRKPVCLKWVSK